MSAADHGVLPYGRHVVEDGDVEAVVRVLRGAYLTTGPAVASFEQALAERLGAAHAISCANGTAALHLAAMAIGLGPGDAVIVPAMTFLATANAARFVGAEVAFADVDAETGLMRVTDAEDAFRRARQKGLRTRVVLPVHLNGQCADMEALRAFAREHGLAVAEDACHAIGTTGTARDGTPHRVGDCRFSDLATFSFHPVKTIAMGEGGAVLTNDAGLADAVARARNHGMTRVPADFRRRDLAFDRDGAANPWYYEMSDLGYNYRASDIHCALGLSQLAKLDRFVEERRHLASVYDRALASLAPSVRPIERVPDCRPAWHLYVVRIDFDRLGVDRAALMHALRARGIGTQVHYIPVPWQPYYRERYGETDLPGASAYYRRALSLPLFPGMMEGDVAQVVETLASIVEAAEP